MSSSRRLFLYFFSTLLVIVAIFLIYLWLVLHWSYSEGERAGYIQKFSKMGWFCKTWEGELALITLPGAVPEKFEFSVSDAAVAKQISNLVGTRVRLTYEQHKGLPGSCFGDTEFFISAISVVQASGVSGDSVVH